MRNKDSTKRNAGTGADEVRHLKIRLPNPPDKKELKDAFAVLKRANESAQHFFSTFEATRRDREAWGNPTDAEQDLLRAGLLFASAGLDAMIKQLIKDAYPSVVAKDIAAREQLANFIRTQMDGGRQGVQERINTELLCNTLVSPSPRKALEEMFVNTVTRKSLQSKEEVLRAASYFAIEARTVVGEPTKLEEVFKARNEIAHEMDVVFTRQNRSRRSRRKETMIEYTNRILNTACDFYVEVEKKVIGGAVAMRQPSASQIGIDFETGITKPKRPRK